MISALDSRSSSPGSSPDQGTLHYVLGQDNSNSASLHTGIYSVNR